MEIEIEKGRCIGNDDPIYFIADIGANHDGELGRARKLIHLAAKAGANAVKFQVFDANSIVSDFGFQKIGNISHQLNWKKSVYEAYQDASLPLCWLSSLKRECDRCGVDFLATPYNLDAVDILDEFIPMYKIGSGDITWLDLIEKVAKKDKPVLLPTGASTIYDVRRAMCTLLKYTDKICLMQCNTNYVPTSENFKYINLNVLKTYRSMYPDVVLGLSDHTIGNTTALGAIALGARVIEKHFTDDNSRSGPDHSFAMTPDTWREMVDRARELELALGSHLKTIEENEKETTVIQRRCACAARDLPLGHVVKPDDIEILRPAPYISIPPFHAYKIIGMKLYRDMTKGEAFRFDILEREWML